MRQPQGPAGPESPRQGTAKTDERAFCRFCRWAGQSPSRARPAGARWPVSKGKVAQALGQARWHPLFRTSHRRPRNAVLSQKIKADPSSAGASPRPLRNPLTVLANASGVVRPRKPTTGHRRLLRPRRERPCGGRASEQRNEIAPPDHSITSSASNCRELGTSMPSNLAVCALMTNSNLLDCTTGSSPGFAPLRI